MTIKRQLLNFTQRSVDVRIGTDMLKDLPRIAGAAVGKPKRVLVLSRTSAWERYGLEVRRALIDGSFAVTEFILEDDENVRTLAWADRVCERLASDELTADDLLFAVGDGDLCSIAALSARLWCGGMSCAIMPTEFDSMVSLATEMHALDVAGGASMLSMRPEPTMVLCNLDLIPDMPVESLRMGFVLMVVACMAEGKRAWKTLNEQASLLASCDTAAMTEVLSSVQLARRNVVKSANPSARRALEYGATVASALSTCLDSDIPRYLLRAEGIRLEARLAVEAAGLDPQVVFDQDDLLEDLGIEELPFDLAPEGLIKAIKATCARRSNRFMLAMPRLVGTVRLAAVSDEVFERHAAAYTAARAELLADANRA